MKRIFLTLFFASAFITVLQAQSKPASCENNEVLAQLDFWVGNWKVYDQNEVLIGTNSISKILKSCAIEEVWTDNQGNKGMSIFYKSPATDSLKQVWITENALFPGGTKEKSVIAVTPGKSIRFQGSYAQRGKMILDRTTLTKERDDQIRQVIELSIDDGQTWQPVFVGIYKRL